MVKSQEIITTIAILILAGIARYSFFHEQEWLMENIIAIMAFVAFFLYHKHLRISPVPYTLALGILILHNLGSFGLYASGFAGLQWDFIVHSFAGFAISIAAYQSLNTATKLKPREKAVIVIGIVLAIAALLEITEGLGALIWGNGEGFLLYGAGDTDYLDTQTDLMFNLVGGFIGLLVSLIMPKLQK